MAELQMTNLTCWLRVGSAFTGAALTGCQNEAKICTHAELAMHLVHAAQAGTLQLQRMQALRCRVWRLRSSHQQMQPGISG